MPHDWVGWGTLASLFLTALWFIIKHTIVKELNRLNYNLEALNIRLNKNDERYDNHETRISVLEDWRKISEKN